MGEEEAALPNRVILHLLCSIFLEFFSNIPRLQLYENTLCSFKRITGKFLNIFDLIPGNTGMSRGRAEKGKEKRRSSKNPNWAV